MRVVFMGTPHFAVPCLQALLDDGHEVCAVFTRPDKPRGRGHKLCPTPVKELACKYDIPVYQPKSLRKGEDADAAYAKLKSLAPEIIIVVAYGCILPKNVLELPPKGCVNVHASLLPKYRGSAPIQWAVLDGEQETGITTMYMSEGLDEGDMILLSGLPIGINETASSLHDRLAERGAQVLSETVAAIEKGNAPRTPQNHNEATYAPMITKEQSRIDFTRPAREVHNLIRGITGFTYYDGMRLKFYGCELGDKHYPTAAPGEIVNADDFTIACGDGYTIRITELQAQCCKRMNTGEYLCGKTIRNGDVLGKGDCECT